ncbi:MAG: hypothetical protein ACK5MY_05470 [Jhaorihella sp.]
MRRSVLISALLAMALPAMAQDEDPMAMQRCVWSCLANSPGASSLQYQQCVMRFCSADGHETDTPEPVWSFGLAGDGRTYSAGIAFQDNSGRGLYYMCTKSGESYLVLYRMAGLAGPYRLRVDGVDHWMNFDRARVELTAPLHRTNPFISALTRGASVQVFDAAGRFVMQVGLGNARTAIGDAIANCQG